mgnify:CR=1 FL=1
MKYSYLGSTQSDMKGTCIRFFIQVEVKDKQFDKLCDSNDFNEMLDQEEIISNGPEE